MSHSITILWGSMPEDDHPAIRYEFKTKGELNAFTLGIAEMDGWMGYEVIDASDSATRCVGDDGITRDITVNEG